MRNEWLVNIPAGMQVIVYMSQVIDGELCFKVMNDILRSDESANFCHWW